MPLKHPHYYFDQMNTQNLTIIIPAYNEESAIGITLEKLKSSFADSEIIVINDGSTDKTSIIAKRIESITVIDHHHNIGYGGAIKTGIRNAKKDFIAWYDADGQHSPEDLMKVVAPVLSGEKDFVIGVRGEDSHKQLNRIPGKFIIKVVAQLVVRQSIPDINSGLRCMKKNIISRYIHLLPKSFSASTTSTLIMMKRGYIIGYEKITTSKRVGTSSVKIIKHGFYTLKLILRILILFDAFNFFSLVAIIQIVPAFIYGLFVALNNKMGFPTLAAMVIISGILTFLIGIVTDQIVAIRQEKFEDK